MSQTRRPRFALWYTLAALLIAGAVALPVSLLVPAFSSTARTLSSMERFEAPGSISVDIDQPGMYSLDYLYQGAVNGRFFSTTATPPTLQATLTRDADGSQILARSARFSGAYVFGDTQGTPLFQFRIDDPGAYTVDAAYPPASSSGSTVLLAFGEPVSTMTLVVPILIGALAGIVLLVAGLALMIVTIVRHARRAAARAA